MICNANHLVDFIQKLGDIGVFIGMFLVCKLSRAFYKR